jgi:putative membrane protein
MNIYLWTKIFHLFFVITWMAVVFCLPPLLLVLAGVGEDPPARERLVPLGLKLYRLGHHLFGLAFALGLVLWLYFGMTGPWLHAKLVLVALLLAHFTLTGRWLKRMAAGGSLPSVAVLRWFICVPAFLLLGILWLVLAKPF